MGTGSKMSAQLSVDAILGCGNQCLENKRWLKYGRQVVWECRSVMWRYLVDRRRLEAKMSVQFTVEWGCHFWSGIVLKMGADLELRAGKGKWDVGKY